MTFFLKKSKLGRVPPPRSPSLLGKREFLVMFRDFLNFILIIIVLYFATILFFDTEKIHAQFYTNNEWYIYNRAGRSQSAVAPAQNIDSLGWVNLDRAYLELRAISGVGSGVNNSIALVSNQTYNIIPSTRFYIEFESNTISGDCTFNFSTNANPYSAISQNSVGSGINISTNTTSRNIYELNPTTLYSGQRYLAFVLRPTGTSGYNCIGTISIFSITDENGILLYRPQLFAPFDSDMGTSTPNDAEIATVMLLFILIMVAITTSIIISYNTFYKKRRYLQYGGGDVEIREDH